MNEDFTLIAAGEIIEELSRRVGELELQLAACQSGEGEACPSLD